MAARKRLKITTSDKQNVNKERKKENKNMEVEGNKGGKGKRK